MIFDNGAYRALVGSRLSLDMRDPTVNQVPKGLLEDHYPPQGGVFSISFNRVKLQSEAQWNCQILSTIAVEDGNRIRGMDQSLYHRFLRYDEVRKPSGSETRTQLGYMRVIANRLFSSSRYSGQSISTTSWFQFMIGISTLTLST